MRRARSASRRSSARSRPTGWRPCLPAGDRRSLPRPRSRGSGSAGNPSTWRATEVRSTFAALTLALVTASLLAQESGSWIVKGRLVVPVEGAPIEKGAIRITGAKIDAIGATTDTKGVPEQHIVDFPDGIIYPGFIDAGSYEGIRRERDDQSKP